MQGVVLQTYGAGNVPDTKANSYLFEELRAATDRGVVVVNCTQCSSGIVTDLYAGGIVSYISVDYVGLSYPLVECCVYCCLPAYFVCSETSSSRCGVWSGHDG